MLGLGRGKDKDRDSDEKTAYVQWNLNNNVVSVANNAAAATAGKVTTNQYLNVDLAKIKAAEKAKAWKKDPRYFKSVKMSALALIKMVMHAKTGQGKQGIISGDASNWIEVMGLLQGYHDDDTFVITDSFAMPVDASEVECSMNEASQLYMVNYLDASERLGKKERSVGWYHSHPGYTCFLSGIDVNTQTLNQGNLDPWIALVVDPVRTISTGKVEVKAFRTVPEGQGVEWADFDRDSIPASKIAEFGVHMSRYYELPITVFRSEADADQLNLLWNKYWQKTLSTSPLVTNRAFTDGGVKAVTDKLEKADPQGAAAARPRRGARGAPAAGGKGDADPMAAVSSSVAALSAEVLQGLMGMIAKQQVFNQTTPGSR